MSFLQRSGDPFSLGTLGQIATSEGNAQAQPQHLRESALTVHRVPTLYQAVTGAGAER